MEIKFIMGDSNRLKKSKINMKEKELSKIYTHAV